MIVAHHVEAVPEVAAMCNKLSGVSAVDFCFYQRFFRSLQRRIEYSGDISDSRDLVDLFSRLDLSMTNGKKSKKTKRQVKLT